MKKRNEKLGNEKIDLEDYEFDEETNVDSISNETEDEIITVLKFTLISKKKKGQNSIINSYYNLRCNPTSIKGNKEKEN